MDDDVVVVLELPFLELRRELANASEVEDAGLLLGVVVRHDRADFGERLQVQIGRVEVYQMIGGPDTGGKSPEGPHTHVLPKLLKDDRTHSANTPIPEGWVPCCGVHPENPVIGRLGEDKPFNRTAFDAFQQLLGDWGAQDYCQGKAAVWQLLQSGTPADRAQEPQSREGRAGWRNGIRQWRVLQGSNSLTEDYAAQFDRGADQTDPENPGH